MAQEQSTEKKRVTGPEATKAVLVNNTNVILRALDTLDRYFARGHHTQEDAAKIFAAIEAAHNKAVATAKEPKKAAATSGFTL